MTGLFLSSQESEPSQTQLNNGISQSSIHQNSQRTHSFNASTTQIAHLADVFSAVTALSSQALMIIKPTGIRIYSEYNHVSNVLLTVDPSLFSSYNFFLKDHQTGQSSPSISQLTEESMGAELRLGVDISLVSDSFASVASSLGISKSKPKSGATTTNTHTSTTNPVSDSVTCYITYEGEGSPLVIEFEDNLMSEKIEFLTFYTDLVYPYDDVDDDEEEHLVISHNDIQFELILRSDVFTNLLQDLQQISTLDLYIYLSNERRQLGSTTAKRGRIRGPSLMDNQLNFISKGPIGHSKLIYPNERTILEKLLIFGRNDPNDDPKPVNTSLISCYNFLNFIKIFRAVKMSSKCKILKDFNGVLSIQVLCKNQQLPNYAGTLITFNMLEVSTVVNEIYNDNNNNINLNNIFDDESYEYIKNYNSKNIQRDLPSVPREARIHDYEPLEEYNPPVRESEPAPIPLSYALFRTVEPEISTDKGGSNVQINETIYESNERGQNNNDFNAQGSKKRKRTDNGQVDDDGKSIKNVGGAVEVPLFL
ncbi:repair protein Rad1/Rec1/Rad17-domain-containing protein [Scheffersomyces xylosifermentans]|uniref:repair protein Rad1/Rec1/Rad17-domain-containing protein n=1 Tax=Scheffersomyces xylosifermentans TaxID=1304137 RepID=UPI00315C7D71